jgi:hypothetical protein
MLNEQKVGNISILFYVITFPLKMLFFSGKNIDTFDMEPQGFFEDANDLLYVILMELVTVNLDL